MIAFGEAMSVDDLKRIESEISILEADIADLKDSIGL
jgi:hypothetical protein